jgi:hypothetical protein
VQFSTSSYTVGEGDGTVAVTVTLSQSSGSTVTVDYATSDGTATSGGPDYFPENYTLTFSPGVTSQTIIISIIDDLCPESNESFTVTLSNPSGATLGTPSTATVTILDNDT